MNTFTEKQTFARIWFFLILGITALHLLIAVLSAKTTPWFLLFASIPIAVALLLYFASLQVSVNKEGIEYKFPPFIFKTKTIYWNDVESHEIRTYDPIGEFGGWGIRNSRRNGKAYSCSGYEGLQLVLTNGKKILIGIRDVKRLNAFLETMDK